MATKKNQIEEYIKDNVWYDVNEAGKMVWFTYDLRFGDCFENDTYEEAVNDFVGNWDNLTEKQKYQA